MTTADVFFMQRFEEYKQFDTVAAMDEHVQQVAYYFADELNATDKAVLDYVKQHALKVAGVAYLKVATIAEAVGKSVRTINYTTKKLAGLGIVKKIETTRKKRGGDGANAYAIMADSIEAKKVDCSVDCRPDCRVQIAERDNDVMPTESKDEAVKTESKSLNSFKALNKALNKSFKNFEKNNTHTTRTDHVEESVALYPNIPSSLRTVLTGFNNARINGLVKRIVTAYKNSDITTYMTMQDFCKLDEDFNHGLSAHIKAAVANWKAGSVTGSLEGYVYVTALNFFNEVEAQKAMNEAHNNEEELSFEPFFEMARTARLRREQQHVITPMSYDNDSLDELGIY